MNINIQIKILIMKLITLNMWGGRVANPLTDFLKKNIDTDIFLFQEIVKYDDIKSPPPPDRTNVPLALPNYQPYFAPAKSNGFGLGAFIKKGINVNEEGNVFVHKNFDSMVEKDWTTIGKNIQYIKLVYKDEKYTIFNFHGLWATSGKSDTEERLKQSEKIIGLVKKFEGKIIICGDFNLRPDTKSIKMLEDELGLRNLITEYKVTSTRTSLYTRSDEKFADYILVSKNVEVKDFKVMPEEVSDHAALYLEFN